MKSFRFTGLVSDTSVRYGHAFKMNYSVQRSFHMILMVPHRTFIQSLPDELEVVSYFFFSIFFNEILYFLNFVLWKSFYENSCIILEKISEKRNFKQKKKSIFFKIINKTPNHKFDYF